MHTEKQTELNRYGLVHNEVTNEQAMMHYSMHCLMTSMAYMITLNDSRTSQPMTHPAFPLVSSSKTKLCQFSSVQLYCSVHAFK